MLEEAKWISVLDKWDTKKRYPASVFEKEFILEKKERLFLSITVHGLYKIILNEKEVGDYVLEPGPSEYTVDLSARCFEISDCLIAGNNVLKVIVADGWYRGCNGIDGARNLFGEDASLICSARNESKEIVFVSDESWKAAFSSFYLFTDTEQGEIVNADGAMEEYNPVIVKEYDRKCIHLETSPFVKEKEHFKGKILSTPNGQMVVDFGQNLAGYTHFVLKARKGEKITLWHGETLDENGNFTQKNFDPGIRNKEGGITQKIEYICKEGINDYKPSFAIFGFRYVLVETEIDLSEADFEAIAVYSDMKQTATFECSDKRLNRLFLNSLWSMKSNFAHIPTDCPTRERAGWTGDAGLFARTASILMDSKEVYRYWLKQCRYLQKKDGKIANIAPHNNRRGFINDFLNGSAGWGDGVLFATYAFYQATNDLSILEENYEMCKKWVDFERKRAEKVSLKEWLSKDSKSRYIVNNGFHFGEWCEPDISAADSIRKQDKKRTASLATAYYYISTSMLEEISEILGKEEASEYKELASRIKEAWNKEMTENGIIHSDRQADYVRPLAFGLLEGEDANRAAQRLNELIKENDCHLNTGFLSTPYLLKVLCKYGYRETAMELLFKEDFPSWLYAVNHGATTLWERWDAVKDDGTVYDSLNHYSYGTVSSFLIEDLGGIHYDYGHLLIEPQVTKRLDYVKASRDTVEGRIESSWTINEDKIEYNFVIPQGLKARIILDDKTEEVKGGTHHYTCSLLK